jgi:hypothetical protein
MLASFGCRGVRPTEAVQKVVDCESPGGLSSAMDRSDWLCQDAQAPLGRHDACVHATGHRYAMVALSQIGQAGRKKWELVLLFSRLLRSVACESARTCHLMRAASFILASQATPARLEVRPTPLRPSDSCDAAVCNTPCFSGCEEATPVRVYVTI